MQGTRVLAWALSGLVLAVAGLALWPDAAMDQSGGVNLVAAARPLAPPQQSPFVPSMQGTQQDGDLRLLKAAPLQTNPAAYAQLVRLFDYYLSAVGEASIDAIQERIARELDAELTPEQARDAKRLLSQYLEFKRALMTLEQDPALAGSGVEAIRQRLLAVQGLRERYFSAAEIQGMFGFEDSYDTNAVARLSISQDKGLSAEQKKAQLAALDAALPEALRADRDANQALLKAQQQVQDMRAKGASDDEVYRMRSQVFSPQAASRLAEVDREEQAWQDRIAAYLSARNTALNAEDNSSPSQREQAVLQLQQNSFSAEERRRLAAYEK